MIEQLLMTTAKQRNLTPLQVYAMPDHIHLLVRMSATIALSDAIGHIKRRTSRIHNMNHGHKLYWQNGYAAFSISRTHIRRVRYYIKNQAAHHNNKKFEEEYLKWLDAHQVEYDMRYVFD